VAIAVLPSSTRPAKTQVARRRSAASQTGRRRRRIRPPTFPDDGFPVAGLHEGLGIRLVLGHSIMADHQSPYLIRHAAHARQDDGTLVGRTPGVGLGEEAKAQLRWLRQRLAGITFDAILSSPLARAVETARAIAGEPSPAPELDEVDFGDWTKRKVSDLADEPAWSSWNGFRSSAPIPGGETMLQIQARGISLVQRACREHPQGHVLLVSHAEVLRALLLHYLGMSPDHWSRLELAPGSLSLLEAHPWGARVLRLNEDPARTDAEQGRI
jgi:broad specificity phosphatase PhoE